MKQGPGNWKTNASSPCGDDLFDLRLIEYSTGRELSKELLDGIASLLGIQKVQKDIES